MEKSETTVDLNIHSSPEEALSYVGDLFAAPEVNKFLKDRKIKGESYQTLERVLNWTFFKETFKKKWQGETDAKWGKRSPQEAFSETLLHSLTKVSLGAATFLEWQIDDEGAFSSFFLEEVKRIPNRVEILADYFRWMFSGSVKIYS